MSVIYKYPIDMRGLANGIYIELPEKAQILDLQMQNNTPTLWALVDLNAPLVTRYFCIYGTGQHFEIDGVAYVGTFQIDEFVWHLFEVL
jgi:hypothetical protein